MANSKDLNCDGSTPRESTKMKDLKNVTKAIMLSRIASVPSRTALRMTKY